MQFCSDIQERKQITNYKLQIPVTKAQLVCLALCPTHLYIFLYSKLTRVKSHSVSKVKYLFIVTCRSGEKKANNREPQQDVTDLQLQWCDAWQCHKSDGSGAGERRCCLSAARCQCLEFKAKQTQLNIFF